MKRPRVIFALVGLGFFCYIGLFPPRKAQLPERSHLAVSRTFLLAEEAYLYRTADGNSVPVEIDTGRMLAEVLLVVAFIGTLLALTPRTPDFQDRSASV